MVVLSSQLNRVPWLLDKISVTTFWSIFSGQCSKLYIVFPLLSSNNSKTLLEEHLCSDHWWTYSDIAAQHLQQELGLPSSGELQALLFGWQGADPETYFQESRSWRPSQFSRLQISWFARNWYEASQLDSCWFSKTVVQFQEFNGQTKRKLVSNVLSLTKPKSN